MRALTVVAVAAAGLAVIFPKTSSAAELDGPRTACARGQIWDGYRCQWANPPAAQVQPDYRYSRAPVYEPEDDDDYVAEAPPVYTAPSYYAYATPYYRPPVVTYYAGPRYVWGHGGYRHHQRWRY